MVRLCIPVDDKADLLCCVAAAFYGFRPVLVPNNLPTDLLTAHLQKVQPDFFIAEAGVVELSAVTQGCPTLAHAILVAKHGSRHMDWNEVPEGSGGKVDVSVWHELVDEKKGSIGSDVPALDKESTVSPLSTFWPSTGGVGELVEYTSDVRCPDSTCSSC